MAPRKQYSAIGAEITSIGWSVLVWDPCCDAEPAAGRVSSVGPIVSPPFLLPRSRVEGVQVGAWLPGLGWYRSNTQLVASTRSVASPRSGRGWGEVDGALTDESGCCRLGEYRTAATACHACRQAVQSPDRGMQQFGVGREGDRLLQLSCQPSPASLPNRSLDLVVLCIFGRIVLSDAQLPHCPQRKGIRYRNCSLKLQIPAISNASKTSKTDSRSIA